MPISATWTRQSTHSNAPYFYFRIEFSEGVSGLTSNYFSYTGTLQSCTFSPSKGELTQEPSLGIDDAKYPTVYNVMVACKGTGSCSGTGVCKLTMSKSYWVGATFERAGGIVLQKTGPGKGTISSTPTGVVCPITSVSCTSWHRFGSVLTLTARAATGSRFVGWAGACSGSGGCVVRLVAGEDPLPVYAIFE